MLSSKYRITSDSGGRHDVRTCERSPLSSTQQGVVSVFSHPTRHEDRMQACGVRAAARPVVILRVQELTRKQVGFGSRESPVRLLDTHAISEPPV